jgi:hypothetical protein
MRPTASEAPAHAQFEFHVDLRARSRSVVGGTKRGSEPYTCDEHARACVQDPARALRVMDSRGNALARLLDTESPDHEVHGRLSALAADESLPAPARQLAAAAAAAAARARDSPPPAADGIRMHAQQALWATAAAAAEGDLILLAVNASYSVRAARLAIGWARARCATRARLPESALTARRPARRGRAIARR